MPYYDVSQICLNGHRITGNYNANRELAQKFCSKCGAETITACPKCNAKIRGKYVVEGIVDLTGTRTPVPAYCCNCGEPYPWTSIGIEAIKEIIDEEESLSESERDKLKLSLPDLIVETPKSNLAVSRLKRALSVVGDITKSGLTQFITDFACNAVKKMLGM